MVLFGALRRLGAVQNPILPIYREREVGFIVRQAGVDAAGRALGVAGLRLRGDGRRRHRRDQGTEVLVSDRSLPEGDPATLPPRPTTT